MLVLNVLGGLAVLLSMFLVINTVNALLSQHVRHIGIMKAVGGRTGQIVAMYLVLVMSYGLLAFVIAAPLSAVAAYETSKMLAGMVNIGLGGFHVVPSALAMQAGLALLIPLAAAAVPVLTGTRVSVRQAIQEHGMGSGQTGRGLFGRVLETDALPLAAAGLFAGQRLPPQGPPGPDPLDPHAGREPSSSPCST